MNMQETVQAEVLEQVGRTGEVHSDAVCCRVAGCDCRDVLRAVELLMAQGAIELRDVSVQLRLAADGGRQVRCL